MYTKKKKYNNETVLYTCCGWGRASQPAPGAVPLRPSNVPSGNYRADSVAFSCSCFRSLLSSNMLASIDFGAVSSDVVVMLARNMSFR